MKKLAVSFLFLLSFSALKAENLTAFFSYCVFDVPGKDPYLETYLNIIGSSVKFVPENDKLRGQVEVQWILKSGEKIVHFDKYNLNSPEIADTNVARPDFLDQQRVPVGRGKYNLELSIRDKNTDTKEFLVNQDINISFPEDSISISSIEFIESYTKAESTGKFTKSGYDIIPYVTTFYPKEVKSIKFYAEIYRSDSVPASDYIARYYISNNESNQVMENYFATVRQKPQSINVLLGEIGISELLSGNYFFNIEIRNKKNEIIGFRQAFFQRSNQANKPLVSAELSTIDVSNTFVSSITNPDTLSDYIASLAPISSEHEAEIAQRQSRQGNLKDMQQYFYYFWVQRNPADPQGSWKSYNEQVKLVNSNYGTYNDKGYETDRGRVYLKYGAPNVITEGPYEVEAFPYEIWQYYKLNSQSNRKFVFYTRERATNDYRLLHSDAIGELQDPAWELKLKQRSQQFGVDLDQEKARDSWGDKTKENFSNPK